MDRFGVQENLADAFSDAGPAGFPRNGVPDIPLFEIFGQKSDLRRLAALAIGWARAAIIYGTNPPTCSAVGRIGSVMRFGIRKGCDVSSNNLNAATVANQIP